MKKLIILILLIVVLIGCKKKTKTSLDNADSVLLTNANLLIEATETNENMYSVRVSVNNEDYGDARVIIEKDATYGSVATLIATAEDSTFMFWVENGRIASKNNIYTFTVTERHNLTAYFLPNNEYASIFIDPNDGLIDFIINNNQVLLTNNEPFYSFGFKFDKFKVKEKTDNYTYFVSSYFINKANCQVKVKNGIVKETNKATSEVLFGSTVTLYSDNKDFSYWVINNQIISFTNEYKLTIYQDIEIVAVLNKNDAKKLLVNNQDLIIDDNQLMFVGQFQNPNNLNIVEIGVIYIYGEEYMNLPIQSWDQINKQRISNVSVNNEFTLYMNLKKGQTINMCTYVKTNNGTFDIPVYVNHYSNIIAKQNN